ncbi:MAG: nitrate- and nitrite sensing domain-containing protein [Actinobacteria bacterium]|nr:nitrate- and nitrite sensing domain-containing protein [Actinomycetota bacterium]
MLRHLGIRWKVLAVLALPVLAMAVASGAVAVTALSDAAAAQRAGRLSAAGDGFGRVAASLQQERLTSLQVLGGDLSARAALTAARERTDADVSALNLALVTSDVSALSAGAAAAVDRSQQAHTRLRGVRDGIDAGTVDAALAEQIYTDVVRTDVDLPGGIAEGLTDRALAQPLTVASLLGRVGEAASREQLAGLAMIRGGTPTGAQQRDLAIAVLDEDRTIEEVRAHGTSSQITALTAALTSGRVTDADLGRLRTALAGAGTSEQVPVTEADWVFTTGQRAEQLRQVAHLVSATASTQAEERVAAARLRAAVALGSVVALVGVSVLLALVLSRRITAPLRRLTDDVTRLASELPGIVGKVATGQEVTLPDVVVDGTDEVGALALAFRSVNATTLEVAHEQAGLRAAVADMFVSVARRNQVLLSRQLAFIDQLERTEESPESLENLFRLDHLATRMRRNAESLLVLAGADGGRRLRAPMPLSDVVRTAVSEIEHFDRVRLNVMADPPVVAHLALPAAHLVAELVENAAAFSDPGAPVLVETRATVDGVRVSVRDSGIGLSGAELADANARLANGGVADVVGSQRLGFFVVARLAAKIGARVHLAAGAGGGTVAHVDLGAVVFVAGTVEGVVDDTAGAAPDGPGESPRDGAADDLADGLADDLTDGRWTPAGPVVPQPVPVAAGTAQNATRAGAEPADAGTDLPALRLVVDLEAGTSAVVEPAEAAAAPAVAEDEAEDDDVVPLSPPEPTEVYLAGLAPLERAADEADAGLEVGDEIVDEAADEVVAEAAAEPVEQQPALAAPADPEPVPLAAYDPLTDPDFVVDHGPALFAEGLGLPESLPEPLPEPTVGPSPEPMRSPLVRVLPDEDVPPAPVPAAAQTPDPAAERTPEPAPAPAPDAAPGAAPPAGLSVPLGAMTVDILPAGHQHRGGLLRGRRAKAADARGRAPERPADVPAELVRRAVTSEEPPSRRAIREGIGWLPPESPDLFPGKDAAPARPWARGEDQDEERLRHAITSEALNELSRLSSYSPTTVHTAPAESLTRRTPAPAPAPTPAPSAPPMSAGPAAEVPELQGHGHHGLQPPETFAAEALAAPLFGNHPPERFAEPGAPVPDPAPASGLPSRVRRGAAPEAAATALPPRPRTADGVRSTVAGFTDGVRRARRVPVPEHDA